MYEKVDKNEKTIEISITSAIDYLVSIAFRDLAEHKSITTRQNSSAQKNSSICLIRYGRRFWDS